MQNYKAIVLDLDGTLLKKNGTISIHTKEILSKLRDRGVKIFLATGRPLLTAIPCHQELDLDTPLICLNGAVVYDRIQQRVISQFPILSDLVYQVKNIVNENALAMVCQTHKANYQLINLIGDQIELYWPVEKPGNMPDTDEPILKMKILFNSKASASNVMEQFIPDFQVSNWGDWFEVTRHSVTKWSSLQLLLQRFGIEANEVIAFGDGINDVDLIKNVGTGVSMGNALPILKAVSKHTTTSHENDGIYHFLANKTRMTTS